MFAGGWQRAEGMAALSAGQWPSPLPVFLDEIQVLLCPVTARNLKGIATLTTLMGLQDFAENQRAFNSKARQLILKKHQLNYLSGLGAGVVGSSLWSFVLEHFGERERARVTYIYILWFENVYLIYISYLYCYINIVFPFSRETEWIWAWRNGPILWLIWVEQVQIFNFNRATDFELWDLERQYPSDMCLGCDFQIFAFHFQVMQVGWEKSMNFRISHLFRCYGVQRAGATLGQLKPCSSMLYLSPVQAGHATSPALRGIQGCRAVRGKEMVF